MNKTIWIYWAQGIENAPDLVKVCVASWRYYNPNWNIKILNQTNINTMQRVATTPSFSDILRINLLDEHGGLWVDATTFCNKPLDDWLPEYTKEGFFAFREPQPEYQLCSWFLYGERNNYIIKSWKQEVDDYWKTRKNAHEYLWFHSLFNKLYKNDKLVERIWNEVPNYKANWQPLAESPSNPHYFAPYTTQRLVQLKDNNLTAPVYKLKWSVSNQLLNNNLIKQLVRNIL